MPLQLPPFPPSSDIHASTTTLTYDVRLLSMEGVYIQGADGAVHDLYRGSPKGKFDAKDDGALGGIYV